jgi:hypothetical protein
MKGLNVDIFKVKAEDGFLKIGFIICEIVTL